ncbi:MAG: FAD:protein FMN transferase [Akkermansiaceae bacterium]
MKRALIIIGFVTLLAIVIRRSAPASPPRELHGSAMGCGWALAWRGDPAMPDVMENEVTAVLEHWEQVLSQWREDSDLSRFNRGEPPTADLTRALTAADEVRTASAGAFDHHILEKVHAAGFGPAGRGVDLSSIGKGFAVDRVGERLKELGVRDFIFNLAGEALAGDGGWSIGIELPDPAGTIISDTITLSNQAIATSGNYRQFHLNAEGIQSHIINPQTGLPVIRPLSSVTVIAGDCATASAWATALFVMGPDSGKAPPGMKVRWQLLPRPPP